MAKVDFYSVLCSLDVMSEISAVDYSNLPVVSTEPVKFLLLNTQVEAVDKLEESTKTLLEDMKDNKKVGFGSKEQFDQW